jgi:Transposase
MIYLGIDWAEDHHDLCLLTEAGDRLAGARIPDGVEGLRRLHELIAMHADNAESVVVGTRAFRPQPDDPSAGQAEAQGPSVGFVGHDARPP